MRLSEDQRSKAIAIRLAEVREARGFTQAEVAKAYGRPQSWIAKLETGTRRLLFDEGAFLAFYYRVPTDMFLADRVSDEELWDELRPSGGGGDPAGDPFEDL